MIKWNKTSEIEPPFNTVFIGCRCKNSDFLSLDKEYKLEDCFPMIKIDKDYRFAVKGYPFTTEPHYWTIDINLPEYKGN